MQECKLLDKSFTATDVDLIFSKVLTFMQHVAAVSCSVMFAHTSNIVSLQIKDKSARKINFEQFKTGLGLIVRAIPLKCFCHHNVSLAMAKLKLLTIIFGSFSYTQGMCA